MLEIIVDKKFNLQLPEDIKLQFIEENPTLITDRIPSLYSLSFEVNPTVFNLEAFGFPNRLTSVSIKLKLPAEIRHSGMILARGEIILLSVQSKIKLQFKGNREPGNLRKNLNSIDMGEYNYGNVTYYQYTLDYSHPSLQNYVTSMRTIANTGDPYVIAPVRTERTSDIELDNQWYKLFHEYMNYYNPGRNDFTFHDPFANQNQFRWPIMPFPYLKDIIAFAFGDLLENNPFEEDSDLSKLVLITMNHKFFRFYKLFFAIPTGTGYITNVNFPLIDNYINGASIPIEWKFKSFMQKFLFADLLKDLMKIFCMTTFPGIKYRMEFNNDVMARTERVNWDDKLAGDPEISSEAAKKYVFKYSNVSGNNKNAARNKPSIIEIFNEAYNDTESDGEVLYKDESTGGMYNVTRTLEGLDSTVALNVEVVNDPLSTIEDENEETQTFEISSAVRPATMNITGYREYDVLTTNPQKHWFVPKINVKGINDSPYIMFWGGMIETLEKKGQTYPCLMAHHTDHFGVKHLNTSLHPEGTGGLIEKFHGQMKAWVEKDKIRVKAPFRLSLLEIILLKIWMKVYFQGRLFYIEKLDYSLTFYGISLVDVDLIEC